MNLNTPVGTVGIESLFSTNEFRGEDWNSVELVYGPGELDDFKKEVTAIVENELKGRVPATFRYPWRPNETRINKKTGARYQGYPDGGEFLRIKRKASHPKVGPLDPVMIRNGPAPATPKEIYAGCKGRAHVFVCLYPSTDGGDPGVTLCLEGFQKMGDGERFGPPPADPSVFDDGDGNDELSI